MILGFTRIRKNKGLQKLLKTVDLCTYQCKAGGGEAGHGVGIWLSLLALGKGIWLILFSRGEDIWIFLRPTWIYLTADLGEKDWYLASVSRCHASRMRRTVWKDQEVMEATENKRRLSGFHCFVFKFHFFEHVFDQLNLLKYCGIKVNESKEKPSRFLEVQLISVWLIRYNQCKHTKLTFFFTLY